jgi:hypothetical protein
VAIRAGLTKSSATRPDRRRWMQFLDMAADRDRFGDHTSVIEFERGDALERVERGKGPGSLLEPPEVDLYARNRRAASKASTETNVDRLAFAGIL